MNVRLTGTPAELCRALEVLDTVNAIEVRETSEVYLNRPRAGQRSSTTGRVYLDIDLQPNGQEEA